MDQKQKYKKYRLKFYRVVLYSERLEVFFEYAIQRVRKIVYEQVLEDFICLFEFVVEEENLFVIEGRSMVMQKIGVWVGLYVIKG